MIGASDRRYSATCRRTWAATSCGDHSVALSRRSCVIAVKSAAFRSSFLGHDLLAALRIEAIDHFCDRAMRQLDSTKLIQARLLGRTFPCVACDLDSNALTQAGALIGRKSRGAEFLRLGRGHRPWPGRADGWRGRASQRDAACAMAGCSWVSRVWEQATAEAGGRQMPMEFGGGRSARPSWM